MQYIDLTHLFVNDMPVYPGDKKSSVVQASTKKKETDTHGIVDTTIHTGMHVGTHIDAPLHMIEGGKRICDYPIEFFFGEGHIIDARGKQVIDVELLSGKNIGKGDVIIIYTGLSEKYRTATYYETHPEITEAFASKLIEFKIHMVGTDTPSPDRSPYTIHKLLLKNDILIIENLTSLEKLLNIPSFTIIALPMNIDAEAAPVRVVALTA